MTGADDAQTTDTGEVVDYDGTVDQAAAPGNHQVVDTEQPAPQDAEESEPEADEDDDSGNREAVKYRRRLRESEAQVAELTGRVEAMQKTAVEELAAGPGRIKAPEALWAGGVQLADLLSDDGAVDRDKVLEACTEVADRLGLQLAKPGLYVPNEGGSPRTSKGTGGMVAAFMGKDA